MRVVSKNELDRLRKKGGVKVKRHLGTKQKTPEPEVAASMPLSGSIPSKIPAPASINIEKLNSIDVEKLNSLEINNSRLENIVVNNTKLLERFKARLIALKIIIDKPKPIEQWEHDVKRANDTGLINAVVSSSKTKLFIHKIHRSSKGVIDKVTTSLLSSSTERSK